MRACGRFCADFPHPAGWYRLRSVRKGRAEFGRIRLASRQQRNFGSRIMAATGWATILPPDELNHAPRKDMHFGYPYCHGAIFQIPKSGAKRDCGKITPPSRQIRAACRPARHAFLFRQHVPVGIPQQISSLPNTARGIDATRLAIASGC